MDMCNIEEVLNLKKKNPDGYMVSAKWVDDDSKTQELLNYIVSENLGMVKKVGEDFLVRWTDA
jgi:hypothetical protein